MKGYLPKNELIFFIPGKSGVVFAHPAKYYITVEQLIRAQARLVKETTQPVIYIEDRRKTIRRSQEALSSLASMDRSAVQLLGSLNDVKLK